MAYATTTMTPTTGSSTAGPIGIVRQEGFQLPSPANSNASNSPGSDPPPTSPPPDATPSSSSFMHNSNVSYIHDAFRKFPSHHSNQNATPTSAAIDIADELASLIDPHSHLSSSTQPHSPNTYEEPYRHNIFDISAHPTTTHHPFALGRSSSSATDMYPSQSDMPLQTHSGPFNTTVAPLNSAMRFETHPDPPSHLSQFRHTPSPSHRSRSRSRAPSVGPARTAAVRRDRRASSISSHVSSTSPPPRPHAILIPGRGSAAMGGFFVPGQAQTPNIPTAAVHAGDYNLPTPDSLSHSFGYGSHHNSHIPNGSHAHSQFGTYASPSSPYYTYNPVPPPRSGTPTSLGMSPSDVDALGGIAITTGNVNGFSISAMPMGTPGSVHPSSLPATVGAPLSGGPLPPGSHSVSSPSSTKMTPAASGLASGPKQLESYPDNQLTEKRRKRRESHNAVERRRRDNINERIGELAGLIPGVLFECDTPLVVSAAFSPTTSSPTGMSFGMVVGDDPFNMNLLGDCGMHVLPSDGIDSLPDLPEESASMGTLKKDPAEDGEDGHGGLQGHVNGNSNGHGSHSLPPSSANGTIPTNGTTSTASGDQITIKANKGMILRKSVEYIRYLQQLVFVQASRGRDLEDQNRALERELATLRGSLSQPSAGDSLGNESAHGEHGNENGNANGTTEEGGLDDKYDWGGDMDVEDVQQRAVRPCHQRRGSRYKQLDQREGLACLQEVELEHEEEQERRGRQRERGLPERTTGIGRSVSRLRGGMTIGINSVGVGGGREGGDMEI